MGHAVGAVELDSGVVEEMEQFYYHLDDGLNS